MARAWRRIVTTSVVAAVIAFAVAFGVVQTLRLDAAVRAVRAQRGTSVPVPVAAATTVPSLVGCSSPPLPQTTTAISIDQNGGAPPSVYPQIGFLRVDDGGGKTLMPLHGTPSRMRRGRDYYYTISSGIKVPVVSLGRDCMRDVGCEELFDGDRVSVPDADVTGATVTLHRYDRF